MTLAIQEAEKHIFTKVTQALADINRADIEVFTSSAPADANFPCVIFQFQSGQDIMTFNGYRVISELTYLVKVAGPLTSLGPISNVLEAIDQALHRSDGGDGIVLSCIRTRPFALNETIDGIQYRTLGGFYDLEIQQ